MFKAYTLGRVFGVELRVHSTLLWLVGIAVLGSLVLSGPIAALTNLFIIASLALSVTLHELGHIGAAHLFGIGTTGVTLYPFGGLARLTREARTATEEIVVAIAGPLVNVALAGLAAIPLVLLGSSPLLFQFLMVNVVLAVFNLVPAYPMDGGRVLRGALWNWLGRPKATFYAARAGQGFAIAFGILGLFWSPMLIVIAAFVFMQATAELARLRFTELTGGPAVLGSGSGRVIRIEPRVDPRTGGWTYSKEPEPRRPRAAPWAEDDFSKGFGARRRSPQVRQGTWRF